MSRKRIGAFIATSHPVAAYGGVRLPPEAMETLAHDVRTGRFPFAYEHDPRFPTDVKVLEVEVRDMGDGNRGVWVEMDVDEEEFESRGIRGFSVALTEPIDMAIGEDTLPRVVISADPSQFDESVVISAAVALRHDFSVRLARLYQFSDIPPARVVVEMALATLQGVPPGLISSALYEFLKKCFLHPKRAAQTIFTFRFPDGDRCIEASLETSDPEVAKEALGTIRGIALASHLDDRWDFDPRPRRWEKRRWQRR